MAVNEKVKGVTAWWVITGMTNLFGGQQCPTKKPLSNNPRCALASTFEKEQTIPVIITGSFGPLPTAALCNGDLFEQPQNVLATIRGLVDTIDQELLNITQQKRGALVDLR
jgi:hypothetical protein